MQTDVCVDEGCGTLAGSNVINIYYEFEVKIKNYHIKYYSPLLLVIFKA